MINIILLLNVRENIWLWHRTANARAGLQIILYIKI